MKKKILIIMFIFIALISLSGCKKENKKVVEPKKDIVIEGKYTITSMKDGDKSYSKEDLEKLKKSGNEVSLNLKKDKTGELNLFGDKQKIKYDNKIMYINDGEVPFTYKKEILKLKKDGITLVFEKIKD